MDIVKIIISVLFVVLSIFLAIVVLMQEGKASGLGAVAGGVSGDTYWSKNKNRSGEGKLETGTKWGIVVWLLLALVLNLSIFA
jgi:protein translocase, SecG subunit